MSGRPTSGTSRPMSGVSRRPMSAMCRSSEDVNTRHFKLDSDISIQQGTNILPSNNNNTITSMVKPKNLYDLYDVSEENLGYEEEPKT